MPLTKVEDPLKALKCDLGMRPTYHQLASLTAAQLSISTVVHHPYGAIALGLFEALFEALFKGLSKVSDTRRVHTILAQVSTRSRLSATMSDDIKRLDILCISSTAMIYPKIDLLYSWASRYPRSNQEGDCSTVVANS